MLGTLILPNPQTVDNSTLTTSSQYVGNLLRLVLLLIESTILAIGGVSVLKIPKKIGLRAPSDSPVALRISMPLGTLTCVSNSKHSLTRLSYKKRRRFAFSFLFLGTTSTGSKTGPFSQSSPSLRSFQHHVSQYVHWHVIKVARVEARGQDCFVVGFRIIVSRKNRYTEILINDMRPVAVIKGFLTEGADGCCQCVGLL